MNINKIEKHLESGEQGAGAVIEKENPMIGKNRFSNTDDNKNGFVCKKILINVLNKINFNDETIMVNFKHAKNNRIISRNVIPQPCSDNQIDCLWAETSENAQSMYWFRFHNIFIVNGKKLLLVKSNLVNIGPKGISILLPDKCEEIDMRKSRRYSCQGVDMLLIQNSATFHGFLKDFCTDSFSIEVNVRPPQGFQWIRSESPVTAIFSKNSEIIFSGECKIKRQTCRGNKITLVLEAFHQQAERFEPKVFRSTRQRLVPSPSIIFKHPLTQKTVFLKIIDISGSGFSVKEDIASSVLLPGMVIPELVISFGSSFKIKCKTQIVYRKINDEEKKNISVRCGVAFLDVNIKEHMKLLSILYQAEEENAYFCNDVDMDSLWEFFFDSGFIYPEKYNFFHANKKAIKDTYKKLYTKHPDIARYFVYQDNGRIIGHLVMMRFYENAWIIQHHAANPSESKRAGLVVLNQIGRFINDSYNLYNVHMNFVFCYFRPENKFPERVFGGVARSIKNPKGCSIDNFAYLHYNRTVNETDRLSAEWELTETESEDLLDFETYYEHKSGGLILDAMDLKPEAIGCNNISNKYKMLGFKREKQLFSLKKDNLLIALIMANSSDVGLNASDLTNSLSFFVLQPDKISKNNFYSTLLSLSLKLELMEETVLLYPVDFAETHGIPFEKTYNLWILKSQYTEKYFKYLNRIFRAVKP